jgi:hypothetical protein
VASPIRTFPLLYTFQDIVIGSGFIADVCIKGRATAVLDAIDEEGNLQAEWWFNGVEPGGLARGGSTLNESYYSFRRALKEIFVEIAFQSGNFDEFKTRVERFAHEVNRPEERDWLEAVKAVKSGELGSPAPNMRRDTEHGSVVSVTLVNTAQPTPELNKVEEDSLAEAA